MRRVRELLLAVTLAASFFAVVPQVRAQWAVIDTANLAQNIMTAARSLEEVNNQITQIQQFVQMLEYAARNVETLPFSILSQLQSSMTELDSLIDRSAQSTYRRVFEVSELLAANRGSALFVQRLYQVHGGLVDDHLRDLADGMITRASNAAIAKFEAALRQDENGFALRYRAQRIVFDCLSANVERISSSETGIATIGEIEQKIDDTGKSECVGWLDNQFGANTRSLEPQRPMPLRVTWSATGPKDDPSMYGRATGGF